MIQCRTVGLDELVVTTFTAGCDVHTLSLWNLANLFRRNQAPIVDVMAAMLTIVTIVPVWIAQRLSGDSLTSRV